MVAAHATTDDGIPEPMIIFASIILMVESNQGPKLCTLWAFSLQGRQNNSKDEENFPPLHANGSLAITNCMLNRQSAEQSAELTR